MDAATLLAPADPPAVDRRNFVAEPILQRFSLRQPWAYLASVGIAALLFAADTLMPRGATPAIGYCLVPVIAVGTRHTRFILAITIACTVLTWAGYIVEPPGASWWMSVFDRLMVTAVLWLALTLIWQRSAAVAALACKTQALEDATRELERSNAELESFAFVIAHDVRAAERDRAARAPARPSPGREIGGPVWRVDRLDPFRADADDGLDPEPAQLRARGVGRSAVGRLRLQRGAGGRPAEPPGRHRPHRARLSSDPLPTLRADPALMGELLQNLVENAIKYRGQSPPRIHVSAARAADEWHFSIADNGIGVRAEDLGQLFQPFRQARTARRGGVGLGLATCKRIVERHGGRISVTSTPGSGATFTFSIPA